MDKLSVILENCYGIKSLNYEFDTSDGRAFLIYAPNGVMKTSFAKVFADVSRGENPSDVIFPQRITKYSIADEKGDSIAAHRIFVVEPYQENFNSTRTATLLVNKKLRLQYESAVKSINEKADQVIKKLSEVSMVKRGVIDEIANAFGNEESDPLTLLEFLASTIHNGNNQGLEKIVYAEIFNEKVLSFLSLEDTRQQLQEYVERYDELVNKSTYFRRGLFDHNNAANVCKSLKDNGFFAAKHEVLLIGQNSQKIEVASQNELDTVIATEKQQILNDPQLAKRFEAIDKAITRNVELRQFRSYLENNPEIIPELANINELRRKLWISYSFLAEPELVVFLDTYKNAKNEIAQVIEKAKSEETEWQKVVSIFHERFTVPFTLKIENQDDVILKNVAPSLIFKYKDDNDEREIGRDELLNVLSTGEKRALYILNVIFDVQSLTNEPEDTVLILDDIADSFDYKNKYAIVEYIQAILETNKFIIFILTHNFDFFRTVQSRLSINRANNCLMAIKSAEGIVLKPAEYLNPFIYWRNNLHNNQKMLIAAIPMVRNLVEYMQGNNSEDFIFLTSLLHQKAKTDTATITELAHVFNRVLGTAVQDDPETVKKIIFLHADSCIVANESINLENKVILSIAIRLLAENLMIKRINDPTILERINSNQTRELFNLFKEKFPYDKKTITLLEKVILMTPEAIHLNSFMYEPILDLSDCHLQNLYNELKSSLNILEAGGVRL